MVKPEAYESRNDTEEDDLEETDMETTLLDQLHELYRQLAAVREDSREDDVENRKVVGDNNKIIVCSMRRCVSMRKSGLDDAWQYTPSRGGFKDAVDALSAFNAVKWVSWPGAVVEEASQEGVGRKLENEFNCKPVFLSSEILDSFHHKFCNVILRPLMHCLPHRSDIGLLDNFQEKYDAFCTANNKFLEAVSEVYNEGDLVLVCDYQLMNLPALLRRRFPDIICGFFLHCPFPSSEFYRMLPVRRSLLQGMLGADLVVFNHFDYVRHFLNACTRMLGLESSPSRVEYNGRLVSLGICPMGIDPDRFCITPKVHEHIDTLKKRYEGTKIIVSVDKLDFCKGIPEKLAAMERLLETYPEWRGNVVMFVIVHDSGRTSAYQYRMLNRQINEIVGRINGRYGSPEYCPVCYLKNALDPEQLTALYNIADVCVVSSLKEGINLQAMEFIASQKDNCRGVLVYSEFAGCASSFKGALLVNPFDTKQVAGSIDTALKMSETTKQIRHNQLSRYVRTYTATLWSQRIMSALKEAEATARDYKGLDKLDTAQLLSHYERSRRRLFLLDYDGTLVPYQSMSQLADPPQAILNYLEQLTADPRNAVYIISGRNKECLLKWFESLPQLGLAAEYGYWIRPAVRINDPNAQLSVEATCDESSKVAGPTDTPLVQEDNAAEISSRISPNAWQRHDNDIDLSWKGEVENILAYFTRRTPGSLLESKDSGFTWHFRDADPDFGTNQAKDMQLHFDQMLRQRPVGVVMAPVNKYVVVRPARVTKGRAVTRIVNWESRSSYSSARDFDFIFVIGDERTDEDMFDVMKGNNCFTCTVGYKISRAQYYVENSEEISQIMTAITLTKHDGETST